jgi:signal transduction histidine kinase
MWESASRLVDSIRGSQPSGPLLGQLDSTVPKQYFVKLLQTAARSRRVELAWRREHLHAQIDCAFEQLQSIDQEFETRLQDAKLAALAELAAGAGHEINNPLAVISGHAQLLLKRITDNESRTSLEAIVRHSRRISEIVSDLMQFARPRLPTRRYFELSQLLGPVADECQADAITENVKLSVSIPAEPVGLLADSTQLKRALTALVRNGIEAAQSGGWVRVYGERRDDCIAIVVEDSGQGPADSAIEHMFDPFFSGHTAGRHRGLGLSTAWRLVRENHGTLRYEPNDNGVTRFVLTLPILLQHIECVPERKTA